MKISYRLQWWDGNGGTYFRCFDSLEERTEFISRIARKTARGIWNYCTWEIKYKEETI